jgi:hypothetical protein
MTHPGGVHTADNAVPPLDPELEGLHEDLRGIHPAIDLILDGYRLLALDHHTTDMTQTLIAAISGGSDGTNLTNLSGRTIDRLADADTNPCLRQLPLDQQKLVRLHGETTAYVLGNPTLHQFASDTSAAIDGT